MGTLTTMTLLLDQMADFTAMGNHFRTDSATINISHLYVLAAFVLAISSSIWALTRWQKGEHAWNVDSPQKLFLELCRVHQLNKEQMTLLRRIVRELQLPHPASLFIDPGYLASAVQLEKFQGLNDDLRKLGEAFFGYHLWRQAQASHGPSI